MRTIVNGTILPLSVVVAVLLATGGGCGTSPSVQPNPGSGTAPNSSYSAPPGNLLTIAGYVGGEKIQLLQNENFRRILADKYHLAIKPTKAGSIEMASGADLTGKDFIWPSNDFAVKLFRDGNRKAGKDQIIFNSPLVIYTGWNIADGLIKQGIVEKRREGYFIVNFQKLLTMIVERKTWRDIGQDFDGKIMIRCTDPTKSNSGNMFAGLVVNTLNNGEVVDETSVESVLPKTKQLFARLGMMETSSGDIFRNFLTTGTRNSMVIGYESQIVEFIVANPKSRKLIQDTVCVLYPEPTVWSSHPIVSLNDRGDRLIEAMMDEEVQRLAWNEHGFRSGLAEIRVDKHAVQLDCIAEEIQVVTPLPGKKTFLRILDALKEL